MKQIAFIGQQQASCIERPDITEPLAEDEISGSTIISLVSPGTELNSGYLGKDFPNYPGYACVFRVEKTGKSVENIKQDTLVFSSGNHCSMQRTKAASAIPLPASLDPQRAIFARLAGVSMSTLNTTRAHPPARVLITGLGPVGNLAAQIFSRCGYWVTAIDPAEVRREMAKKMGIEDVRANFETGESLVDQVQLHVECSGHEKAVLEGCGVVRKRGEIVLVGVPWQRRTDIYLFDVLKEIFHRYVDVRGGWEWEIPYSASDFVGNSIAANYRAAMEWIADGKINIEGMASIHSPEDAQNIYRSLLSQTLPTPTALFQWEK